MIDLKKPIAVSELFRNTRGPADRWALGLDMYASLPVDEQGILDEQYRVSAPIFGMPSLMSYIFEEVAGERMKLQSERINAIAMDKVCEMAMYMYMAYRPDDPNSTVSHDTVFIGNFKGSYKIDMWQIGTHVVSCRSKLEGGPPPKNYAYTVGDLAIKDYSKTSQASAEIDSVLFADVAFSDAVSNLRSLVRVPNTT